MISSTKPVIGHQIIFPQVRDTVLDLAMKAADWAAEKIPAPKSKRPHSCGPMRLVAHRGAWRERGCLENTFSAFDRARESGVWGLEFDVRFSRDEVAVVHHDDSLLRTFGRPTKISTTTFNTLRHEANEIPTYAEVVAEYSSSFHLFIEIKDSIRELTEDRARKLIEPLASRGLRPIIDYHFMAFDLDVLRTLSRAHGFPKKALISIAELKIQSVSDQTLEEGFGGFTCHWLAMSEALLLRHHIANQSCGVGFLNSQVSLQREWSRGVDWAFTNEAVKASQWLDEISR